MQEIEPDWRQYNNQVARCMREDDITNFTNWRIIRQTMFSVPPAAALRYLESLPDWEKKWKDVIVESPVGNPEPYKTYPQSSGNTISIANHFAQFISRMKCKLEELDTIFEFGAGYGCACRMAYNLGFTGKYVILDLPAILDLQRYYLERTAKGRTIQYLSDSDEFVKQISDRKGQSLFIAQWSISESPLSLRKKVLTAVCANIDYILIGFQEKHRGFDNWDFFVSKKKEYNPDNDYQWDLFIVSHLIVHHNQHYYLFGKREV